jgi:hypothetical protein
VPQIDFTHIQLLKLYKAIEESGYEWKSYKDLNSNSSIPSKTVILRHDVDQFPKRALECALLEKQNSIVSTYFFRKKHFLRNTGVIKKIIELGHFVGYHYENLADFNGNVDQAILDFENTIKFIRQDFEIKWISAHGSPMTRFNNQSIWSKSDALTYNLIDISNPEIYKKNFYLTDTGRSWNNEEFNLRDRAYQNSNGFISDGTTSSIIDGFKKELFPDQIIINVHPQRWNHKLGPWLGELLMQSVKNPFKYAIGRWRGIIN